MAQLTINVPDTAVPRIRTAFGHRDPNNPSVWIDATVDEVRQAVQTWIKGKVVDYESNAEAIALRDTKSQENWGAI